MRKQILRLHSLLAEVIFTVRSMLNDPYWNLHVEKKSD